MKKIDVSFLLPSLNRPTLKNVVESIHDTSKGLNYEILIMGPEDLKFPETKFVLDSELNGQVKCYNFLARNIAQGKYLVHTMDDQIFLNSISLSLDLLESPKFAERKYKICTLQSGAPCAMPAKGTRFGSCLNLELDLKGCLLMRFPVLTKDTLLNHLDGYLYHPEFFSHAVDNYLGYFLAFNGEPAIESETILHQLTFASNPKYIVVDCNTCLALMLNLHTGCNKYVAEPNPDLVELYLKNGKFLKENHG